MIAKSLLSESKSETIRIFYSYARRDDEYRTDLNRVLAQFQWDVSVSPWYDGDIPAGVDWENEIDKNLASADIILLFITQGFVDSKYCQDVELPEALRKHKKGGARVIPIILEEIVPDWRTLDFSHLQVLPKNGIPLNQWPNKREAFLHVSQGIVDLIVAQGLFPNTRCRWELHLDGDLTGFTHTDKNAVTEELRNFTGDRTLRPVAQAHGSIALTMESTQDAVSKVVDAFEEGAKQTIAGFSILDVFKLFGASIHAGTTSILTNIRRPKKLPDPDLILLPSRPFEPVTLNGLKTDKTNPLRNLDWVVNKGDSKLEADGLKSETAKLLNYFLTCIAIPEDDAYVNLAPDKNVRLLSESLSDTQLGNDLLEFDYRLKRLSASLLHPDIETGRAFWKEVKRRIRSKGGIIDENLSTFQRVWIVPEKAVVYVGSLDDVKKENAEYEKGQNATDDIQNAYIVDSKLKAMTEQEYLATYDYQNQQNNKTQMKIMHDVFKEIVLPVIEKEINSGENFAVNRQIYNALILACWFKGKYKNHPKVKKFIDSKDVNQLTPKITAINPFSTGKENKKKHKHKTESGNTKPAHISTGKDKNISSDVMQALLKDAVEYRNRGDVDHSIALLKKVVNYHENLSGRNHPETQAALSQLGRSYREKNDFQTARSIHEEVLEIRRQTLGNMHPFTCNSMEILADTLLACGDIVRARNLQADAAENRIRQSKDFSIKENREYFERYLDIFKNGVFYLERDEYDIESKKKVGRVYFSGAIDFRGLSRKIMVFGSPIIDTHKK